MDPGDENDWRPPRWTFVMGGSWMVVLPALLGLHWEFVREVNDGHDDVHGNWKLLYDDGSPATAEDREYVLGKFTPPDHVPKREPHALDEYTIKNL